MTTAALNDVKLWLEILSHVVVLVGVPFGLYRYIRTVQKEQQDREYGTYNALDEKYIEFQRLCLDHPELDIFDVPRPGPKPLSEDQARQELIIFTILFAIFERAYLMYSDESTRLKKNQWSGWDEYIRSYCRRANFVKAWTASGATFDKNFEVYMAKALSPNSRKTPSS